MKQKGFTLIELLAVLVILSLIAAVVFPAVTSVLKDTRKNAYESQIRIIEKAAKEYYLDNVNELPAEVENESSCLSIGTLISAGYIAAEELNTDGQIINPQTNDPLEGSVTVTYESNQYNYKYEENKENECS